MTGPPQTKAEALVRAISNVGKLAASSGREDLAARLEQTQERLRDPNVRVIVVGEFKQGKSKLINALVNAPACPVDDDIATSVPTSVGYAERAVRLDPRRIDETRRRRAQPRAAGRCRSTSWRTTSRSGATRATSAASSRPRCCCPGRSSRAVCKLVDSPGVGGLDSSNALATLSALSSAHAVLLVSDASQEYTEPEVQFLKHAMRISPNVAAVLAKTDLYPEWRQIEQHRPRRTWAMSATCRCSRSRATCACWRPSCRTASSTTSPASPRSSRTCAARCSERAELIHERSAVHDLALGRRAAHDVAALRAERARAPRRHARA